jgi:tetratricopeptide (TPR) repeat protein
VHGVTTVVGDSVQFNVALYDAIAAGRPLRRASIRVATGSDPPDSLFALLADSMLFGRVTWEERPRADIGTASLFARLQYGAGHEALQVWNLAKAESLFSAAATHDPDFARAQLWLAQVRNWSGHGPRTWGVPAERALRAPGALGPREHHLASGLVFLAGGQFRDACRIYDVLRERDPRDFAAWYGRGECHARDDVVVRDSTAPSGWSFRSSYHQAVEAYQRAFEVLPLSHRGFSSGAYERVRSIFVTRPNGFRWGTAGAGNTERFIGWPVWQSDTLAFLPYPWAPGRAESPRPAAAIRELAIVQHRRAFYALANGWANAFPSNAEAAFAVAVSLEMMGDPAALDALRRARRLPAEPSLRLRLAASEVWVRVKFAVPHNPADLTGAAALADSLINATVPSNADEALILAELAGLIGRPAAAAQLARRAARADADAVFVPAPLVGISNALLAFAAAGAPNDSIIRLEREAEEIIRKTIPRADRPAVRALHIERAAILAFPAHNFAILNDSAALQSPLAIAQGAWVNGDTASAGRRVSELREALDASEMTLDMLYPTAYLLALLGDTAVAISSLAAGLEALRGVDPGVLDEMGRAGVLARSMALLATLSAATGDDRSARRWAAAVVNLLGHAESWPGMPVDRLRRLTNAPEPLTVLEKQ